MNPRIEATLAELRARRGFAAERCIAAKVALIVRYFKKARLTTAVVGVSGGVDSAVVLGLLTRAAQAPGSPVRRVVGVLAPYGEIEQGVSNQRVATERGREVVRAFAAECVEVDLSAAHAAIKRSVEDAVGVDGDAWADGQLVSNLRTPALYQVVTLLAHAGEPGVLFGTTTRDEGSYIGYFGKASDGLCDVQPISDLHKWEVYALAASLGVPDSVVAAAPTGDIWDGRDDLALIGAPFDAVELYTQLRCLADDERAALMDCWDDEARAEFAGWQGRIEQLHRENAHKYLGGSPAVHLDVYERAVPGGWRVDAVEPLAGNPVVNEVRLAPVELAATQVARVKVPGFGESVLLLEGVLTEGECERLLASLEAFDWVAVGVDGRRAGFDRWTMRVGSFRLSSFHEGLARAMWTRIAPHIPAVRVLDENCRTDWDGHPVWRASGVNPLLRFISYPDGGGLVPHYDSTFARSVRERTLMSMIVNLTDVGETRIIKDSRRGGEYRDWPEFARDEDVELAIRPRVGSAVLLDHRVLHDAGAVVAGKAVIRTDVFYVRCGPAEADVFPARMLGMPGGRG